MSHRWNCPDRSEIRRSAERDAERRSYADRNKYGDCYEAQRQYERDFEARKYEKRREEERREQQREYELAERRREQRRLDKARDEYLREQDELCEAVVAVCLWTGVQS